MVDAALFLAADSQSGAFEVGRALGTLIALTLLCLVPVAFVLSVIFAIRTKQVPWIVASALTGMLMLGIGMIFSLGVPQGFKDAVANLGIAPTDNGTVVSADGKVRIDLPKGWRKLDSPNPDATLLAGNPSKDEYLMVISHSRKDFDGTLEDHAKTTLAGVLGNVTNPDVTEPISRTVNGMRAIQREIRGVVENRKVAYLHTSIEGADAYHQVLAWTLQSQHDTSFPVLRQAVESFREIPASPPSTPGDAS